MDCSDRSKESTLDKPNEIDRSALFTNTHVISTQPPTEVQASPQIIRLPGSPSALTPQKARDINSTDIRLIRFPQNSQKEGRIFQIASAVSAGKVIINSRLNVPQSRELSKGDTQCNQSFQYVASGICSSIGVTASTEEKREIRSTAGSLPMRHLVSKYEPQQVPQQKKIEEGLEIYSIAAAVVNPEVMKQMPEGKFLRLKTQFKQECDADLLKEEHQFIVSGQWESVQKGKLVLHQMIREQSAVNHGDSTEASDCCPEETRENDDSCDGASEEPRHVSSTPEGYKNKTFPSEFTFTKDANSHKLSPGNDIEMLAKLNIQCNICEKIFVKTEYLKLHKENNGSKTETCKICYKSFHKICDNIAHSKRAHPELWKGIRQTPRKSKLEQYELADYSSENICQSCCLSFSSWLGLAHHEIEEHGGRNKCRFCMDGNFANFSDLLVHLEFRHFNEEGDFSESSQEPGDHKNKNRRVKRKIGGVEISSGKLETHIFTLQGSEKAHDYMECGEKNSSTALLPANVFSHTPQHNDDVRHISDEEHENSDVASKSDRQNYNGNPSKGNSIGTGVKINDLIQVIGEEHSVSDDPDKVVSKDKPTGVEDYGLDVKFKKVHVCELCGIKSTKVGLLKHKKRHHQQKCMICKFCRESFVYHSDLEMHIKRHYDKNGKFRQLRKRSTVQEVSRNKSIYRCKVCCKEFTSQFTIRKHVKSHLDKDGNVKFITMEVPIKRPNQTRRNYGSEGGNYECGKCRRKFLRLKDLNLHRKTCNITSFLDENDGSMVYKCDNCSLINRDITAVLNHLKVAHKDTIYNCDICQSKFPALYKLKEHLTVEHAKIKSVCNICAKEFDKPRYLAVHMKRHSGVKSHVCPVCGKDFYEKYKLTNHMATHSSEKLSNQCDICHKLFQSKEYLAQHMNIHRGTLPYKCTQCDKAYPIASALSKHMIAHSEVKPYVCPEPTCGKAFKFMTKLRYHMAVHTGVSNHVCNYCKRVFTEKCSLNKHKSRCKKDPQNVHTQAVGTKQLMIPLLTNFQNHSMSSEEVVVASDLTKAEVKQVFMCSICKTMFNDWAQIELHMQEHSLAVVPDEAGESISDLAMGESSVDADYHAVIDTIDDQHPHVLMEAASSETTVDDLANSLDV